MKAPHFPFPISLPFPFPLSLLAGLQPPHLSAKRA